MTEERSLPSPTLPGPSAIPIVRLKGDLDIESAPRMREELQTAMMESANLIVSIDEVRYLDSSALGVLLTAYRRAVDQKGALVLVSANHRINRIFSVTGVNRLIRIFPTLDEARSSFH